MNVKTLLVTFLIGSCTLATNGSLRFGAFNIHTLGVTKMGKPDVVAYLTEILARYDIVLIQELRDASGVAIVDLLNELNNYSSDTYDSIISSRLGRSSYYKEQYVYFYKSSKVTLTGWYEYQESNDQFEREPFIVRFQPTSPNSSLSEFVVAGLHAKPDDAEIEVDYLTDVYDDIVETWGLQNVTLAGDFNADCSYITESEWPSIRLRNQSRFTWLIPDDADTTVSNTDCAYDRLVVAGSGMLANSREAQTYQFDTALGLNQTTAKSVSDHYPVEMIID